ncbi:intraflagellar transport protein 122 homolog isoform X2 [Manduca sexta]|uniref:intraflagellar transport protein 122 homolog isoform X1 n=1 Tax=Manduca sexta TaxID=7130 RepID=UPI0011844E3A|nr:intraflagellar transport protein 122 homolog isoform X1 [Manduca sexta]XP_037299947.1 intraflagellar transport protein 122 homolog isoform X2 [Manduca sexta]
MRTLPKWVNKIHEADKIEFSSVHAICFSPDGTQLVVGAGEKLMVYDPRDGALVQLLQAHKGAVHAVSYCGDGKKFASGSADKNVIIWTSKMEGILKYSHSESIQCIAYNPVTFHLASCAVSDFAFWSTDVKAVQKYRVSGRITSCAWSHNGQYLAIGLACGLVSIRDKTGEETNRITRESGVWAVAFLKSTLIITDWTETISFYNVQGQQVCKDRNIGIAALSVTLLGGLVLVGGVGGWAVLTSEGVSVINTPQEWVWAIAPSPTFNTVAVGCQDGTLWCYQVVFSTVHGLYRERYAYRENMTDVIIQHLTTGSKVRIKCHDRVQKIAIYKHRLAVQLPERVVVYEQGDADGMLYRVKEKLPQKTECSLLVATSDALLICQDTRLTLVGKRVPNMWVMPAPIRYVKVTTLYFEEVLLLGLMNGQIWQVEPSNGQSRMILQTAASVRCLDVSASRRRLAVVDETSVCKIYCLPTGDLMYSEENVSSVSWNSWCEELLGLSGSGVLSIKAGSFPPATQPLIGSVVGFQGGRVFCLQANSMQTINVPLSHAVHQYVQQKMFNEAYAAACLGVTPLDWERLGYAALEELSFEVARKAFQRSENVLFLTLIDHLQERLEAGESRTVVYGEVLAYRGRYSDAARSFRTAGRDDRALNLYVDLRMFNKAQEYVGEGEALTALARRRAEWARHVNEPRAAAEMYLAAGDVRRAAQLMAETGRRDMLIELARKLDKGSSESLRYVAEALVSAGELATAGDVYQRLGDYCKVAQLAVSAGDWTRAFTLAREHTECRRDVYLPYAHRMAQENKFVESQKAYHMAGETATAMRVFTILVGNAVAEERFGDAGYLHHLLGMQCLDSAASAADRDKPTHLQQYHANERLAHIYHAYDAVHRCIHEPFSLTQPDALLNGARYVLALLDDEPPLGVSMFCLYLCLAKQAKVLQANTLAHQMLDKIQGLIVPQKFQESVELLQLKTRASGSGEARDDEVSPLCWRCRRHASPLCAARCPHCGHEMVHSLATHEILPLVEFVPAEGITNEEAMDLIERSPLPEKSEDTSSEGNAEILRIEHDVDAYDPFQEKVEEDDDSKVVTCSRASLLQLSPAYVVIVQRPQLPPRFYRNMLPELPATMCPHCYNLFYLEDYEIQLVTKGHCPFCRHPMEEPRANDDEDDSLLNDSNSSTPNSPSTGQNSWR